MATQKGFCFNQNYCIGCNACQTSCKVTNKIDIGVSWRKVETFEVEINKRMVERFLTHSCMHCGEPECVKVCPATAYTKREKDGLVIHDSSKCIGCQYCIRACPYQAPKWNANKNKAEKCSACHELIDQGEDPACVRGCPVQVLKMDDISKFDSNGAVKEAIGFPEYNTNPSMRFIPLKK